MCPLQLSSRWNSLMTKTKIPVHYTWRGSCGWTAFWKDPPRRKFENPDPGQYHHDQSGQWPWDRRQGDCMGYRATGLPGYRRVGRGVMTGVVGEEFLQQSVREWTVLTVLFPALSQPPLSPTCPRPLQVPEPSAASTLRRTCLTGLRCSAPCDSARP